MSAARPLFVSFVVLPLLASSLTVRAQGSDLFAQTASAELTRQFGGRDLSWLLLDSSGRMLAMNWEDANLAVSPGSLLKPFIAVAYGEQHGFVYPHVTCTGIHGRCWLSRGHGTIGLEKAIAGSCNAYFLALADALDPDRADAAFTRFGLSGPPKNADSETFIGLKDQWRETPLNLARAYLALVTDAPEPARQRILSGMRSAAESGTAREVNIALGTEGAMAKTGTATCSHHPRAAADGFALVLFPALQPRLLLLVRMHGATGARAAIQAGAMLHVIGMGAR